MGEKVPADLKTEVESKVAEVRQVAQGEDVEAMKMATEALGQVIQKIGASAYQEPQAAPEGSPDQSGPSDPGPDVVDGEVKE